MPPQRRTTLEEGVRVYNEAHPNPAENWSASVLAALRIANVMAEDVPCKPLDFYTCPFRRSKIDRFLGSANQQTYFSSVQRSRVLYEILSTAMFGKKKKGEVGIDRLVEEGVFSTAFSLHDGPYHDPRATAGGAGGVGCTMNPRQVLYEFWARWGKWYKYQPLDHIREYFGEKIAIYFAWLGFYTGWLLPAALVGVLVFLYGLFTMHTNPLANQVCNSEGSFLMCPLCDEDIGCKYWDLSDVCGYARLAYLFDHPGTVFYAIFISLWAVTFLEYWKRKCASLAHHWDCTGFQEEEERPRPEFAARAPFLERNPVTGVREPSFPASLRHKRVAAGIGIIFLMMSLVIIFIVAVIIYRVLVSIPLFQNATFRSQAQSIANLTGAVVNLVLIMAMSRVYEKLAFRLTSWEMHRTQTEFDDNLTFKVFIFQFVNFYSSIFYIAFFKGRFVGYPGNYTLILRLRNEDCSAGGCLIELAQQLAVIMIGKQMINNAQELLVPKLKAWWQKKQVKLSKKRVKARWEEDYQLIDSEGLFQEYLEMVLQFGFITIFVAAFPLAPLFALLNNWVEIRLDAHKLVCETRRPVAERAENIGIWFKILHMLAHLAVISNGFLIAFTSEFLPKMLYQYEYHWNLEGYVNFTLAYSPEGTLRQQCRYRGLRDPTGKHTPFFWRLLAVRFAFVIIFEHVVFGICRLIDVLVPDIPESLELKIKRERYLAKQALQDSDTILRVAASRGDEEELGPPFGGMVLDLTSELGGLMPPLIIAAPSSTEVQRAAQEAAAGPSVLSPQPLISPALSTNPSTNPTPSPAAPSTPSVSRRKRSNSVRSRPRPRPKTVIEDAETAQLPRHSMSAGPISNAKMTGSTSSGDSGANTVSVPEESFKYDALQGDEAEVLKTMDTVSSFCSSGEEEDDRANATRKKQRITVRRRDRPVSEFVGEVIHKNGEVKEVLRHSVPSKLDHVIVTIPQQHEWMEESSSMGDSSSTGDDESVDLGRSLANAAVKSAAAVASIHVSSEVQNPHPPAGTNFSVASDLSSLVSHDQDSFSDLHLRHGSPKKTPSRNSARLHLDHSNSLGSDMSSIAGQDPESFSDLPLRHMTFNRTYQGSSDQGRSIESDLYSLGDQETELSVKPSLARASSSRAPKKPRKMPPREQSVSVTSNISSVAGQQADTLSDLPLRHATARTDINQVGSELRESSNLLTLNQQSVESELSSPSGMDASIFCNLRKASDHSTSSQFSQREQDSSVASGMSVAGFDADSLSSLARTPSDPRPTALVQQWSESETAAPAQWTESEVPRSVQPPPPTGIRAKRVPPPPPPRRRIGGGTSQDSARDDPRDRAHSKAP